MNKMNIDTKEKFEHSVFFNAIKNIRQISIHLSKNNDELNNKLISIYINNNKILDSIISFSISIKSRLKQKLLTGAIGTLGEIDNEILKKSQNLEIVKKLSNERRIIEDILKEEIDESINIINFYQVFINNNKEFLSKFSLKKDIDPLIITEEKHAEEVGNKILLNKENIFKLKEKIDIITKSEDIINNESIIDIFNASIPSKETISSLNIDISEKNILKLLIDSLDNLLSQLDKGFTYQNLIETRHQLIDDYLAEIKNLSVLENQKRMIIFTQTYYHSLVNIEFYFKLLAEQLTLLEQYWCSLIYQLTQLKNNILDTNNIIEPHLLFLGKFLDEY
ncbi:hypothetical protein M997_2515 [Proteus hauseri ATCC 700826]|uniref:Toxin n=1 Tax=Proteus hauseri ATCC 700826 TaxID=1354271 RepID=A0AAJ3LT93_PROHU|nr:alpha-xenorhabdolysin family binary toxin subunit B [Proteus hauseri]OAT46060.1 hypothetical protein M997_2515 [Proteus hauseri ATCC 700826]